MVGFLNLSITAILGETVVQVGRWYVLEDV